MWFGWEEVAFFLWLLVEVPVQSDESVEIAGCASIGCDVLAWFLGNWTGRDYGWDFYVFEEFLEESNEEGVDLGVVWVYYVEDLQEGVFDISDILHGDYNSFQGSMLTKSL